ncbi:MAG: DUF4153 domain-containing protein [Cellvibrionaceae bacterium]
MSTEADSLPKPLLLLIALAQGLVLLLLHQAIEFKFWPGGNYPWLFCFYAMVTVGPLMLLLSLETGDQWKRIVPWVVPFTLVAGVLGYYTGGQVLPEPYIGYSNVAMVFGFTLAIATFKALMYAQQRATGEPFQYSFLFQFSWRNFLILGLSLLFTLAVWGILMLWGALFEVININFFMDLFTERWFYYPALALAHGFGVIIFRSQSKVIDTVTRIQQALMKFLLVFLVLVSVLFLAALPFTGLAPLWETGNGSMLILWMQGIILFFLNAVYQDDPESRPYPDPVHRFIYIGIALLPVYSAIAFYGLWLRVEQYGWTPARSWGFLVWAFFALFSIGYLWGIIRLRDHWLRHLSWVNVRLGLLVLATMLLINSPLLDFRKISVSSQMNRLASGEMEPDDIDLYYFRRNLARPGYEALQELKPRIAETHPEIAEQIDNWYTSQSPQRQDFGREYLLESLELYGGTSIPESLEDALYDFADQNRWRLSGPGDLLLLQVDMDGNGQDDYVLIESQSGYRYATLFYRAVDGWHFSNMTPSFSPSLTGDSLQESLEKGRWQTIDPRWRKLDIGGNVFIVQ